MNEQQPDVAYECSKETFKSEIIYPVRWLDLEADYELARVRWCSFSWFTEPFDDIWYGARDAGYQYAAVIEEGRIVAIAAIWRYSDSGWELAAVSVDDPANHRRGLAKSVCSFVTTAILKAGRRATCHTRADNIAMQRTAESIGYWRL